MSQSELCFMEATELVQRIRTKEVSCVEVMEAHLAQIERVNPKVNAIVTLLPELSQAADRFSHCMVYPLPTRIWCRPKVFVPPMGLQYSKIMFRIKMR